MTPSTSEDSSPAPPQPISFKDLFLKGSFWAMVGHGASQVVGLCGNIIVCRLLLPEVMGLMLVVNTALIGLAMFSDIGLGASVIQNKRGEDPAFLCTAWTMNIARGFCLWLLSIPVAITISRVMAEPLLMYLVPIAALNMILASLGSLSLLVLRRRIQLDRLFWVNLSAQLLQVSVMVVLAWAFRSVWALVIASFVPTLFKLIASHTWLSGGYRMRIEWDREAAHEIFHFGFWVFFSSIMTFLVGRFDVFILGSLIGLNLLGVYGVAKKWTRAVVDAVLGFSSGVLFPLYSRIAEHDARGLRRRTLKARAAVLGVALPPLWFLAIFGPQLLRIYGENFAEAQWMVQLLAAGAVMTVICQTIEPVLLAKGNSFRHMMQLATRFSFQFGGFFVGYHLGGVRGLIIGIALADVLAYPIVVCLVRKYDVWLPGLDFAAMALSAAVIGLGWHLFQA
jgi:O-antigen/teichoic acid export membrane protein